MPLYGEESVSHPNLFAFLGHLQRTTVDSQHWRRQGRQGAQAPQWPGKNFFVKIEGLLEPVVLNLSFRVRSNAMFTYERRY